jgi:holliday junction DNA helicase RuvB
MSGERVVNPSPGEDDQQVEKSLRPKRLAEYIGQEKVVEQLKIAIAAAKGRKEPLDHTLLYGPPGLGKTSLAGVLANEMGVNIKLTSGPAIERQGDLAAVLTNLQKDDILFIDEIHRLNRAIEEVLYPAMEDFALDEIVVRSARILGVATSPEGASEIARRARGTPRIVNRLLRRVRDYAQVVGGGTITLDVARRALAQLEVDELGLDENDRRLLRAIIELFNGGPVGLSTLAAALAEEVDAIEDVYEPFLLQLGFMQRTPRGRIATRRAYEHLGIPFVERQSPGDDSQQGRLWS